jgi:dTDP-4-amino-4,6-dideoxygalactose transaminase
MARPLYVAQPLLPEIEHFQEAIAEIWRTKILSNDGPFHKKLEAALRAYLGVPTAMLFNNGTAALLVALKLLKLPPGSEVITTPLTFAATAHAIEWNGLIPVFADILPRTLTLDPEAVKKAISSKTSAILAVHVYGTICELDALQQLAGSHGIGLIYDAAHAFGVTVDGVPIGTFGDASVFSFHATKLFNTAEGGLVTTNRATDKDAIYFLRNFGILDEERVVSVGINGKMNELQAVLGLLNLPLVEEERRLRSVIRQHYFECLRGISGIEMPPKQRGVSQSEQYFRVCIDDAKFGRSRDEVYTALKNKGIFARKYFHPICTDFDCYRGHPIYSVRNHPHVEIVKRQVLCLPFHSGVEDADIAEIRDEFRRPKSSTKKRLRRVSKIPS